MLGGGGGGLGNVDENEGKDDTMGMRGRKDGWEGGSM